MTTIVLVLLFIFNGQLMLEQKPMPSMEVCYEKAQGIIDEQVKDPRFDVGLYADCIAVKAQSVSSK